MPLTLLQRKGVQSLVASLLCIVIGLLDRLCRAPGHQSHRRVGGHQDHCGELSYYPSGAARMKYLGSTPGQDRAPAHVLPVHPLSRTRWASSIIGAAGQYVIGAGASLYFALAWGCPGMSASWRPYAGALLGGISGALKAYCNVNEVISPASCSTGLACTLSIWCSAP